MLEGVSDSSRDQAEQVVTAVIHYYKYHFIQIGAEKVQPTKYENSVLESLGKSDSSMPAKKLKQRKAKRPNPLSCKKKSKSSEPAPKTTGIVSKGHKRRIRKRRQQAAYMLSKFS